MTNETIVDLSLAIGKCGLFKLKKSSLGFEKIGVSYSHYTGLPLLTESLAKKCPELIEVSLSYGNGIEADWLKQVLLRSLRDAGRTPTVYVYQKLFQEI